MDWTNFDYLKGLNIILDIKDFPQIGRGPQIYFLIKYIFMLISMRLGHKISTG